MPLHALLGASSAQRWLNCPPSARLTEFMEDTGSRWAAAGTLAHANAELKARRYFTALEPRTYEAQLEKLKRDPAYCAEMDGATDVYLEHLKSRAASFGEDRPFVALEVRVDYSNLVPEGFGTADCIMLGGGRIEVIDYKNGAGEWVDAEGNYQLMLYALGALNTFRPVYGGSIRSARLSIVQPHAGGVKEWDCAVDDLEQWAEETVRPIGALAWAGKGEYLPGGWCRFCRARPQCRAYSDAQSKLAFLPQAAPELLSGPELGERLALSKRVIPYAKMLEAYILKAMLDGAAIPGWKVVEGRGSYEWSGGPDAAFPQLVQRGVDEALLYERTPITAAKLKAALGAAAFQKTAEDLVKRLPGPPAAAPESDRRPPYRAAALAFGGGKPPEGSGAKRQGTG